MKAITKITRTRILVSMMSGSSGPAAVFDAAASESLNKEMISMLESLAGMEHVRGVFSPVGQYSIEGAR